MGCEADRQKETGFAVGVQYSFARPLHRHGIERGDINKKKTYEEVCGDDETIILSLCSLRYLLLKHSSKCVLFVIQV